MLGRNSEKRVELGQAGSGETEQRERAQCSGDCPSASDSGLLRGRHAPG